jgi:uncharacterized protein YbbK (DUF523 family)
MRSFAKPKVVLSKCIEFANCRYDGSMIPSDFVKALEPHVDFIPVCAEMEIGLGVPRDSIRIVSIKGEQRLTQPTTGQYVSEKMRDFSTHFLSSLPEVDGFILKYRSPSCGMKDIKVYSGSAKATAVSKTAHSQKQAKILANIVANCESLDFADQARLYRMHRRESFLSVPFWPCCRAG